MTTPHEALIERTARAICATCEENPDHAGDARGNEYRWQDYADAAVAALAALEGVEPVAQLHDDGYWTPAKTEAGRQLSERLLLFAGSPTVAVYTTPPAASQVELVEQFTKGYELGLKQIDRPQSAALAPVRDEREAFEAWLRDSRFDASSVDGQYSITATRHFWMAWQARAALANKEKTE